VVDIEVNITFIKKALPDVFALGLECGRKFLYMFIVYGIQGVVKSAFLKKFGGAWISDSLVSVTFKEAY
ncbi:VapE domain-containing protein, partial [Staphylococcus aureus]